MYCTMRPQTATICMDRSGIDASRRELVMATNRSVSFKATRPLRFRFCGYESFSQQNDQQPLPNRGTIVLLLAQDPIIVATSEGIHEVTETFIEKGEGGGGGGGGRT